MKYFCDLFIEKIKYSSNYYKHKALKNLVDRAYEGMEIGLSDVLYHTYTLNENWEEQKITLETWIRDDYKWQIALWAHDKKNPGKAKEILPKVFEKYRKIEENDPDFDDTLMLRKYNLNENLDVIADWINELRVDIETELENRQKAIKEVFQKWQNSLKTEYPNYTLVTKRDTLTAAGLIIPIMGTTVQIATFIDDNKLCCQLDQDHFDKEKNIPSKVVEMVTHLLNEEDVRNHRYWKYSPFNAYDEAYHTLHEVITILTQFKN